MTRRLAAVTTAPCPNAGNHQWHPDGYSAHSGWADKALVVADQERCPGCDGWEIWVPKRPDLRIAEHWLADCDWGGCDTECVGERFAVELGEWLPVCEVHAEVDR